MTNTQNTSLQQLISKVKEKRFETGDIINIYINGKMYLTFMNEFGRQYFKANPATALLLSDCGREKSQDKLRIEYNKGKISSDEYLDFCVSVGYSIESVAALGLLNGKEVQNPVFNLSERYPLVK